MPLIEKINIDADGVLGVWHITEEESELLQGWELYEEERHLLDQMKGEGRRKEFLASRLLLHMLSGRRERAAIYKDDLGKPHLRDSDHHISLSHSGHYAAVIASRRLCGVDIQVPVRKIYRIFHRFASVYEQAAAGADTQDFMHLLWGAKECVFKAYGLGGVDFREQIYVPDVLGMLGEEAFATLCTPYAIHSYDMHAFKTSEYYLTYGLAR